MKAAGLEPGCDKTPAAVKYQLVSVVLGCYRSNDALKIYTKT